MAMTMRYAHLAPDHKRSAMENLGKVFSLDIYIDTKAKTEEKKVIVIER